MTQLSDDCFAHGGGLMRLGVALDLLRERMVAVVDTETVPLERALGRILAQALVADMAVPPFDNSAVDGYAVYYDDLAADAPTRLPVTARVVAGHPLGRPARRGEALRVFTGAALPSGDGGAGGPDTIFMQEDCTRDGETVVLPPGIERGANWRDAGEDVRPGAEVLAAGRRLRPEDIGLGAALGRTGLAVFAPLKVALFSTGDEVREPGTPLEAGVIYDSNRYTLAAMLRALGCRVSDLGILPDDPARLRAALGEAAGDHQLLITSGGMSVGEEDHVKGAVEALGALSFWRLAIKPGRPVALGTISGAAGPVPFLGLPGNPVAVVVTFLRLARPLILLLSGARHIEPPLFPVRAGFSHRKKRDRLEFVRCRLERAGADGLVAVKAGRQGAGILSTVAAADGLVELDEDMTYVEVGTTVRFLPFSEVL